MRKCLESEGFMKSFTISDIQIVFLRPQNGLLGFASIAINDCIRVDGIAIYSSPTHHLKYRINFPTKKLASGRHVPCFYPYRKEIEEHITKAVVEEYLRLEDNFHYVE